MRKPYSVLIWKITPIKLQSSFCQKLPDSVRARHILIAPQNQDYAQAKNIADSLAGLLRKGADFEELAKTNSVDQNSAVNGGDLGWFTSRTMVQPFSDSAFFSQEKRYQGSLDTIWRTCAAGNGHG